MQQYQNYWTNNYPQYQQPVYPNQQFQQMNQQIQQNPYIDQLSQLRNMQQLPMQQAAYQGLTGRIVEDFNVITANDVPMDGNGAIFIKRDGSEIQVRNWTAQGTIATNVFKPVQMEQPKEIPTEAIKTEIRLSDEVVAVFQQYFERINKRFDKLEQSITPLE